MVIFLAKISAYIPKFRPKNPVSSYQLYNYTNVLLRLTIKTFKKRYRTEFFFKNTQGQEHQEQWVAQG